MRCLPPLLMIVLGLLPAAPALAQDGAQPADESVDATADPPRGAALWTLRAARIRALAEGSLEPDIDARALFELPLDDPALAGAGEHLVVRLRAAMDELRAIEALPRWQRRKRMQAWEAERTAAAAPGDATAAAVLELEQALIDFFRLDARTRRERFESHARRRHDQRRRDESLQGARAEIDTLERQVAQLAAFFEGELDPAVDPGPLLRVDLGIEVGGADAAGAAFAVEPGSELEALRLKVRRLRQERSTLRLRFARMGRADRRALLDRHAARKAAAADAALAAEQARRAAVDDAQRKAEQAAREREAALEAAEHARTEGQRMLASERARLLSVKETLSGLEAEITRAHESIARHHERALEWSGKVRALQTSMGSRRDVEREAHALFHGVGNALSNARARLRTGAAGTGTRIEIPELGPELEPGLRARLDASAIDALRTELIAERARLLDARDALEWAAVDGLMQDMALMNDTRLSLMGLLSEGDLRRYTGTGPDGVAQVKAELDMIGLQARHRLSTIPMHVQRLREDFTAAPLPFVLALAQLLLCVWVFLWWRRRADGVLAALQRPDSGGSGEGLLSARSRVAIWYLRRIRQPLEWLLLFAILTNIISLTGFEAEVALVRVVLLWTMTGAVVVNLVDAIAARQQLSWTSQTDTGALRTRSLRLLGIAVVAAGLVLALSEQAVGRGAIDAWVRTGAWILAAALLMVIVRWWRDIIFQRLERLRTPDATVRWVLANRTGLARYLAATVGGGYLIVRGLVRFGAGWAGELEAVKRLAAHLFRSEVQRKADERAVGEGLTPIDDGLKSKLREPTPDDDLITDVAAGALQEVCAAAGAERSFCAVVGERGIGKSTLLRRVKSALEDRTVHVVRCPVGGFSALQRRLCETFELPEGLSEDELRERLTETLEAPVVVCLDDAQRLIRPTIGGLAELDHLARFARELGDQISWVVAVEGPSYRFVERARGQRLLFDRVIRLGAWSEQEIAELVRRASKRLSIAPDFGNLVVPSRFDDPDESNEARAERGFHRILWDYAAGNPSVAQHFWAESLVTRGDTTHVRLFPTPALTDLEDLPSTVHFVLRTVLQLELASERAIVDCTNLAQPEVADALRFVTARGYVDRVQRHVRIARPWYRAITTVLRRQHLLAGG